LGQIKDPRVKEIFLKRHLGEKKKTSWVEIAKSMNISHKAAVSLYNKGRDLLKHKYFSTVDSI
jgi:hypothetical protein